MGHQLSIEQSVHRMVEEEEEEGEHEKTEKQKDAEEEDKYRKAKLSEVGRSVFEPTLHEMSNNTMGTRP